MLTHKTEKGRQVWQLDKTQQLEPLPQGISRVISILEWLNKQQVWWAKAEGTRFYVGRIKGSRIHLSFQWTSTHHTSWSNSHLLKNLTVLDTEAQPTHSSNRDMRILLIAQATNYTINWMSIRPQIRYGCKLKWMLERKLFNKTENNLLRKVHQLTMRHSLDHPNQKILLSLTLQNRCLLNKTNLNLINQKSKWVGAKLKNQTFQLQ